MEKNDRFLSEIAELYYNEHLSQNDISNILGLSRATISRALLEARNSGIVEITVHTTIKKNRILSEKLKKKYGLKHAIVIAGGVTFDSKITECGKAVASFLDTVLGNNMTLGIVWGRAVRATCEALEEHELHNIHVAQMAGCLSDESPNLGGLDLALRFSEKLNGTYTNIYAPIVVKNKKTAEYIIKEKPIKRAVLMAESADIIISGIGSSMDDESSVFRSGCYVLEERQKMIKRGGIAIMLGRWIDTKGNELPCPNHYIISASLNAFKRATWSIGICVSKEYTRATRAAIEGEYFNILVVDEELAVELLGMN